MKELKNNGYYYGALLYVFCIPLHQKLATFALIAWLLLSLFSFKTSNQVKNKQLLWLPLLYLLYFIGISTSETFNFRFLETKLSFLVFPLIFFLHAYDQERREKILKFFVFGLLASVLICLIVAFKNTISFEDATVQFQANVLENRGFMESIIYGGNYFFGSNLSVFHQTVYYALYLCVGVSTLLFYPKLFVTKVRYAVLVLFVIFIFLVSNKASFIALALIFLIRFMTVKLDFFKKVVGVTLSVGLVVFLVLINPRSKESVKKVKAGELVIDKDARYGFSTRLLSWDAALTLIKENPVLGYGASETQHKLNEVYAQKEYKHPLKENYNAHNLWLQTWLENGLAGVFVLATLLFFLFRSGFKDTYAWGFALTLILVLLVNSLFESMFNRFSGISFFSFVSCYVLTNVIRRESEL